MSNKIFYFFLIWKNSTILLMVFCYMSTRHLHRNLERKGLYIPDAYKQMVKKKTLKMFKCEMFRSKLS